MRFDNYLHCIQTKDKGADDESHHQSHDIQQVCSLSRETTLCPRCSAATSWPFAVTTHYAKGEKWDLYRATSPVSFVELVRSLPPPE